MRVTEAARETKTMERSSMAAAYSIYTFFDSSSHSV